MKTELVRLLLLPREIQMDIQWWLRLYEMDDLFIGIKGEKQTFLGKDIFWILKTSSRIYFHTINFCAPSKRRIGYVSHRLYLRGPEGPVQKSPLTFHDLE